MRLLALLLGPFLALTCWNRSSAQTGELPRPDPVILTDGQEQYPLGLNLEILEDPGRELTIDEVSSPEFQAQFTPSQQAVPNFGFTDSAIWVRLHLRNESQHTDHWLLEQGFANTHYVDPYTPAPDGNGFSARQSGALRPAATRDIAHPRTLSTLPFLPKASRPSTCASRAAHP